MKIAAFMDTSGALADFTKAEVLRVFTKVTERWTVDYECRFERQGFGNLEEMRTLLDTLVPKLKGCSVFLLPELWGVLKVFLGAYGFRLWTAPGSLEEQLDYVASRDEAYAKEVEQEADLARKAYAEEAKYGFCSDGGCSGGCSSGANFSFTKGILEQAKKDGVPQPLALGKPEEGRYRINLSALMEADRRFNSKQILLPFMAEAEFKELEILCDHLPRWFGREAFALGYTWETKELRSERALASLITLRPSEKKLQRPLAETEKIAGANE